jgi:hypothetical protein
MQMAGQGGDIAHPVTELLRIAIYQRLFSNSNLIPYAWDQCLGQAFGQCSNDKPFWPFAWPVSVD